MNENNIINSIFRCIDDYVKTQAPSGYCKYTASMPVKAIFNVKTEESVPVLDDDGNPVREAPVSGEKGPGRLRRKTVKLEKPILASKVFFEDGTWTVVKNSGEDAIELTNVKLEDGTYVTTASDASKERALAYAIVKHAFGYADPVTHEVKGANLGRRFEKVLKASIDKRIFEAKSKIKKIASETARKPETKKPEESGKNTDLASKKILDMMKSVLPEIVKLAKNAKTPET